MSRRSPIFLTDLDKWVISASINAGSRMGRIDNKKNSISEYTITKMMNEIAWAQSIKSCPSYNNANHSVIETERRKQLTLEKNRAPRSSVHAVLALLMSCTWKDSGGTDSNGTSDQTWLVHLNQKLLMEYLIYLQKLKARRDNKDLVKDAESTSHRFDEIKKWMQPIVFEYRLCPVVGQVGIACNVVPACLEMKVKPVFNQLKCCNRLSPCWVAAY